jgi:hypothetical protein
MASHGQKNSLEGLPGFLKALGRDLELLVRVCEELVLILPRCTWRGVSAPNVAGVAIVNGGNGSIKMCAKAQVRLNKS